MSELLAPSVLLTWYARCFNLDLLVSESRKHLIADVSSFHLPLQPLATLNLGARLVQPPSTPPHLFRRSLTHPSQAHRRRRHHASFLKSDILL